MENNLVYSFNGTPLSLEKAGFIQSPQKHSIFPSSVPDEVVFAHHILTDAPCEKSFHYEILDTSACFNKSIRFFYSEHYNKGYTVYTFMRVDCTKDMDCIIYIPYIKNTCLWIDSKFCSMKVSRFPQSFLIHLSQGVHTICYECINPTQYSFVARISSIEYEDQAPYFSLTKSLSYNHFPFDLYTEIKDDKLYYGLLQTNFLIPTLNYSIKIYRFPDMCCICSKKVPANLLHEFNYSELTDKSSNTLLFVAVEADNTEEKTYFKAFPILLSSFDEAKRSLINECNILHNQTDLSTETKLKLEYWAYQLFKVTEESFLWPDIFVIVSQLINQLKGLSGNVPLIESNAENERFYFYSKLDGMPMSIPVRIPKNYNPLQKHPLLIYLPLDPCSTMAHVLKENTEAEPFICADISPRGVTLGSYVGDASIQEGIEELKKHYSIDEKRIYLFGFSSGSFGSWAQAIKYPHRYAGIMPISGSPNWDTVKNIGNTKIISYSSTGDEDQFKEAHAKIENLFKDHPHFTAVKAEGFVHSDTIQTCLTPHVLKELFTFETPSFPQKIEFTATSHRSLKSYWVTLHGITPNEKGAHFSADIGTRTIQISVQNATGLSIQVPSTFKKVSFEVVINDKAFVFENCNCSKLHFAINGSTVEQISHKPQMANIYKGNGIYDIFLSPLKVLLCPSENKQLLTQAAKTFSSPRSNGFIPEIFVNYPVLQCNRRLLKQFFEGSAAIILDAENSAVLPPKVKKNLAIKTSKQGFSYNGKSYDGEYCILQTIQNPYAPNHSVVYISANSQETWKKSFFTRSIIITSYFNGHNPLYNNAAIIFWNNKYFTIFDYGEEMKEMFQ